MPTRDDILLKIEIGAPFSKTFRWKNKFREPIILTGYQFRSQFRSNLGTENILCTLDTNEGITVNSGLGEITIHIPSEITSTLNQYSSGLWSIEYCNQEDAHFKKLIGGRWQAEIEVTV